MPERDNALYTETTGCTNFVTDERGTTTGFVQRNGRKVGAFIKSQESPAMFYAELGAQIGDRGAYHEVNSFRAIDRAEFDVLSGITEIRAALGWGNA